MAQTHLGVGGYVASRQAVVDKVVRVHLCVKPFHPLFEAVQGRTCLVLRLVVSV